MSAIEWDSKLATGNTAIDNQHKMLIQMVNDLHAAIIAKNASQVMMGTLTKLAKYTIEHFAMEEGLMNSSNYPGYPAHKKKHDDLAAKAKEIIDGYQSGQIKLTLTLSNFLADWVFHHIKEEDMGLANYLKSKQ